MFLKAVVNGDLNVCVSKKKLGKKGEKKSKRK